MANVKFLYYQTKAKLTEDIAGKFPDGAIAFCHETGEIYTHGKFYNALSAEYQALDGALAAGDSIETAIAKLDKQVKAATSAAGVKSISAKGSFIKNLEDATGAVTIESNDDAIQNALNAKVNKTDVGVTIATLEDGKVPASQLPSFVDDVLEYDTYNSFPETGETGKIYVSTDDNKTYRWSGTQYVGIGSSLALGETSSTAYAGDKGKKLRDDVDGILKGDKELVTPVITNPQWSIFKNDGTDTKEIKETSNITLLKGYKAQFSGSWKWTSDSSKKDPEATSGIWGTTLPESGVASDSFTGTQVSANTTYTQTITAAKKGLMVSGSKVVPASGTDSKSCSASVSFVDRIFYGIIDSSDPTGADVTNTKIQALKTYKDQTSKAATIDCSALSATQRLVYAYPASYGVLTVIKKDGVDSVISAFSTKTVSIDTGTGAPAISYQVYYSGAGAVSSKSSFSFS